MTWLLAAVGLGVVVGALSSFLGIGGGVIIVAFLAAVGGFSQHEAQATALTFMVPTAAVGVLALRRSGLGDLGLSAWVGLSGAVASIGGALLALALPGEVLRYVFATFIGILGAIMVIRPGVDVAESGRSGGDVSARDD